MKYVVVQRFDDGSKKGGLINGKSSTYEKGEVYSGPNEKDLLAKGLIKAPEVKTSEPKAEDKKAKEVSPKKGK